MVSPGLGVRLKRQASPHRYEWDGESLTQVVEHRAGAYPIVADPCFWGRIRLSRRVASC